MTVTDMTIGLTITTPDGSLALNDRSAGYAIAADNTRESVQRSYNQIKATSPALAGEYLVHSVPGMVVETVTVFVYGSTKTQLNQRIRALVTAFESWSYTLTWAWDEYSEVWTCNAAVSITSDQGQVMLHNHMAKVSLQVPRFPTVTLP